MISNSRLNIRRRIEWSDENALPFSVAFDPALLDFSGAEAGTGAAGASFSEPC